MTPLKTLLMIPSRTLPIGYLRDLDRKETMGIVWKWKTLSRTLMRRSGVCSKLDKPRFPIGELAKARDGRYHPPCGTRKLASCHNLPDLPKRRGTPVQLQKLLRPKGPNLKNPWRRSREA
ncbi:hypothetical protein IHE45_07G075000 [Dioscorea alata]|uniref:Uncharacterized protein n=1 Tax=Dioscorea alata TaxID=55571 RepID=A0ACB7VRN2_DIOAL|nr:hypothetical protein IHE45_07G075000 [Dioscorea alata]